MRLAAALLAGMACAAQADPMAGFERLDQAGLREVLIETGTNLRAHERHEVAIEACEMTTYWWRKREGTGWIMWSSFQFPMASAVLGDGSAVPANIAVENHFEQEDMALFVFEMVPGAEARHEVPFERRRPDGAPRPSPRGDGTTHHYMSATNFFVRHENRGIADRARRFSAAYVEYVARYCNVFG